MLSDRVGVEASCIGNGALSLRDSDDERPRFAAEPRCPVAHVAESLHDDPLAVETNWQTQSRHVVVLSAGLAQHIVEPPARRLGASADAALVDRLAGHTAERVDLGRPELREGVGDPGHLSAASAIVGRRHVDRWTDQVLAHQFVGVAPGDTLDLVVGVGFRVDLHSPFGTAERDVDDRALERHQRRQRHHLVFVHLCAVADAALERQPVMTVLGPPRPDYLQGAVDLSHRKVETIHAVASLDLIEQTGRIVTERSGAVERPRDVCEEAARRGGHRV